MNDLTRRAANGAPVIPDTIAPPPLPESAGRYLRDLAAYAEAKAAWQAAHPDEREGLFVGQAPRAPLLLGAERGQVEAATAALDRDMQPVTATLLRAWLAPVNAAVRNPQPHDDFVTRVRGLFDLLSDLPAGAFTAEARRDLPAFFPSAADIRKAVEPGANRLRRIRAGLTAFDREPERPAQAAAPPPPTDAEIAAVRAKLAAFQTEQAAVRIAGGQDADKPRDTPRYLNDRELEAQLVAAIAHAQPEARGPLQFRLDRLRERVGAR